MGLCYLRNILLAAVNERMELYVVKLDIKIGQVELKLLETHKSGTKVLTTCVDSFSETVVAGDLMTAVAVYSFARSSFEFVARHHYSLGVSAVKVLDESKFVAATDKEVLVYQVEKSNESIEPKDRFYVGQRINRFVRGSLRPQQLKTLGEEQREVNSSVLGEFGIDKTSEVVYATAQGSVGVMVPIPEPLFKYLNAISRAVLEHENGRAHSPPQGKSFVRGAIVESLLRMDKVKAERIYNEAYYAAKPTFKKTLALLNQLSLLH